MAYGLWPMAYGLWALGTLFPTLTSCSRGGLTFITGIGVQVPAMS